MTERQRAELRRLCDEWMELGGIEVTRQQAHDLIDAIPSAVLSLLDALDAEEQRSAELAERLAEAEKDTRRLDTLERNAPYIDRDHEFGLSWCTHANEFGPRVGADTLRALADALEVDA